MLLRRNFPIEQKLQILREAAELGVTKVLQQYKLSYSVFARWRQRLSDNNTGGHTMNDLLLAQKEIEALEQQNTRLKRIIANQALELEMLSERIKKKE